MAFSLTKEQQAVVDDRGGALLVSAALALALPASRN